VIKDQVEELIEESYLLSLSETEIRNYLRNFLNACETILKENISIHDDIKIIGVKIALLKYIQTRHQYLEFQFAVHYLPNGL